MVRLRLAVLLSSSEQDLKVGLVYPQVETDITCHVLCMMGWTRFLAYVVGLEAL